ncbi:MAG: BolA family transcriptional regulator [Bdellovibrio sp.]|nr:BolA family transcriptional regulator [Bdellovibrio sp.]
MKNREHRIIEKMQALNPLSLEVKNDSDKHAGHVEHLGSAGFTGETHYKLMMTSADFNGKSRVDRQRMVMDLLKDEFSSGLHALEIKVKAADEV